MAHINTIMAQMLKTISRHGFQSCVEAHNGDKRIRTMDCWTQFVAMLFGQITQRKSLRDSVTALETATAFQYHWGIGPVRRSTLADANEKRPNEIYADFFAKLYGHVSALTSKPRLRIKAPIRIFDASVVDLCLSIFDWATFQETKAAVKLHTTFDLNSAVPSCVVVTEAAIHETNIAWQQEFDPGSFVIFDRGVLDYHWFAKLDAEDIFFVTRLKSNAAFEILESRKATPDKGLLEDQTIAFTGFYARRACPTPLRRVVVVDPESGEQLVFLTNAFHLAPSTIAKLYRARWQVELFFKWIKQHLRVKTFFGTSPNAVKTQIWIALIAYVLLAYVKYLAQSSLSMLDISRLVQMNLFRKLSLGDLLHRKFARFRPPNVENQLAFQLL
jgi:putative transposase